VRRLFVILFVVILFGLDGCGSSERITTERSLTFSDVLTRAAERDDRIQTLNGKGSITIETPEASNSGSFRVRLKKPDSLTVEIRGPFGVRVATLALTREQFLYYDWMENRAIVGKPEERMLRQILHLAISFQEIFGVFTGVFPQNDSSDTIRQFTTGNDAYNVLFRSSTRSKQYSIDGETYIIKEYSISDNSTGILMTASASDFTDDTPSLPQFLRIVFPAERRSITITYDDIRVNVPVSCVFEVPKQAEIIYR
jgi:outer membrane lipoprotein-sorting protein